jgi:hypothetical protein
MALVALPLPLSLVALLPLLSPLPQTEEPTVDKDEDDGDFKNPFEEVGGEEGNPDMQYPDADESKDNTKRSRKKSPMKSKFLVSLAKMAVTERPNISNKDMRSLLKPYVNDIFITDALLQRVRTDTRNQVFGDPSENVQLLFPLGECLDAMGHHFEISTKTQKEVIQKLEEIILNDCVKKAKKDGEKMKRDQMIKFVKDWKEKNRDMLVEHGLVDSNELHRFVGGIFMSISSAKQNVSYLQTVYQADATHVNFGKNTLYSCYGITPK